MTQEHRDREQILEQNHSLRNKCLVYTRVMGYHRPVESFNIADVEIVRFIPQSRYFSTFHWPYSRYLNHF